MEFFDDPLVYRPLAVKSIKHYGYAPEHNLDWFEYVTAPLQQPVFVHWPDGTALLTGKEEKVWYIFSEPLAPAEKRAQRIVEFLSGALEKPAIGKVVLELESESRKELLHLLPKTLKDLAINYTLIWPIMNMEKFDPELPGSHFKSIRNARNKFYRENNISVAAPDSVSADELHQLVEVWKKTRGGHDRPWFHRYHALIDNKFKGCKTARVMTTDDKAIGLNAGWEIPNSNNRWYGAIGIHNYSIRDLGLMLYLEDLIWIKKAGYKTADMGGGEKALTNFKNQFLPESWYKTFVFSVVKG
ncbi:MAG: GNAT family N-acetyltransferase [Parcubacteria group bacterium]|nr:GNAT family N-acetyltransferase [Parcubacteria group bacterium]